MSVKTKHLEIDNVFYSYAAGNTFISIWTRKEKQWATIPAELRVSFVIGNPGGDIAATVKRAIRAKIADQRREAKVVA